MPSDSALAAQIGLQVRHQESAGDSFSCDIAQYQPHPILTEMEEVIIIATYLAGLNADARVIQCSEGRKSLWKESGLYLLGNLKLVGRAAFGFQGSRCGTALCFHCLSHFVEAD